MFSTSGDGLSVDEVEDVIDDPRSRAESLADNLVDLP